MLERLKEFIKKLKNKKEAENKDKPKEKQEKFISVAKLRNLVFILLVVYIVSVGISLKLHSNAVPDEEKQTVSYNEFITMAENGEVDTLYYNKFDEEMYFTKYTKESLKLQKEKHSTEDYEYTNEDTYYTTYPAYEDFRKDMLDYDIKLVVTQSSKTIASSVGSVISLVFPLALLTILFLSLKSSGMNMFGNSAKTFAVQKSDKRFTDVIGQDEILDDIKFVTNLIKDPTLGKDLNAKVPKGILLVGDPGTGKTLIAKAIAGEANVPFIYANASGFIEMFVGLGAKRVRNLFETAKKNKPCIIFIDEIDAIGRKRSNVGNNSENDQTINQLLQEMDGFAERDGIFVIAATNRLDDLDDALVRAGRFDRHIVVPKPRNWNVRQQLFEHYLKDTKLAEDVDLAYFSKQTHNFTGADIEAVCNEATLIAVMDGKKFIDRESIEKAIDKKIFKGNRSAEKQYENDIKIVAYHEAGHAVMTYLVGMPIARASIISSTSGVGGFVMQEDTDSFFTTQKDFENKLAICYAGRISEQIKFGDITTGASNDITQATQILREYVTRYGFDREQSGIIDINVLQNTEMPSDYVLNRVTELSKKYYDKAYDLLYEKDNYALVEVLAKELLEKETLNGNEIQTLLDEVRKNA